LKFTENPRHWRKVLMYIALSKLPSEEPAGDVDWQATAVLRGVMVGTVFGCVLTTIPAVVLSVIIQLIGALFFRSSIPELSFVIGGAAAAGATIGWITSWVCFAGATFRYTRETMVEAVEVFLDSFLLGAGVMVGLVLLVMLSSFLNAVLVKAPSVPSHALPIWSVGIIPAVWPLVTVVNFFRVLNRTGKRLSVTPIEPATVGAPPRGRLLFRRGKSVARTLPTQGGTMHTHPMPPKW
jgi:hypothetical protein